MKVISENTNFDRAISEPRQRLWHLIRQAMISTRKTVILTRGKRWFQYQGVPASRLDQPPL